MPANQHIMLSAMQLCEHGHKVRNTAKRHAWITTLLCMATPFLCRCLVDCTPHCCAKRCVQDVKNANEKILDRTDALDKLWCLALSCTAAALNKAPR